MIDAMKQHGAFSWNELVTNDIEGAKTFYSQLFNWQLDDMTNEGMEYTTAKVSDQMMAGMMSTPPDAGNMPPMWGSYVTVDDVDASAKQVVELGGQVVMEPRDIPNVGRFCVIVDPQGAALSLITYFDQ
ncbi:MAG: VOC family protein [Methyloligellaceae bacterium]